jgi:L-ascorbate metabolism protein UlaG (beta-lactamase superfamily)
MKIIMLLLTINFLNANPMETEFTKDVFDAGEGELAITFIGHGTLLFEYNDMVIHIDPTMNETDYAKMPDADMILITHHHGDHLDPTAINLIIKEGCPVVMTQSCLEQLGDLKGAVIMKNGDQKTVKGILIEAIPAYNIEHKRSNGQAFHPKGIGNAYLLSIGDLRILIGGDTENVPEIKALKDIDMAFLPMNLPYTMTPEMVADAARAMQPKILYPYHFGQTDPQELVSLLKDEKKIEVRIRDLQ